MSKRAPWLLSAAAGGLFLHGAAPASDTTTYTYDALGRLVAVSTAAAPGNRVAVPTGDDSAVKSGNCTEFGCSLLNETIPAFAPNFGRDDYTPCRAGREEWRGR